MSVFDGKQPTAETIITDLYGPKPLEANGAVSVMTVGEGNTAGHGSEGELSMFTRTCYQEQLCRLASGLVRKK